MLLSIISEEIQVRKVCLLIIVIRKMLVLMK